MNFTTIMITETPAIVNEMMEEYIRSFGDILSEISVSVGNNVMPSSSEKKRFRDISAGL